MVAWAFCPWSQFTRLVGLQCGRDGCDLSAEESVSILHSPRDRRGRVQKSRITIEIAKVTPEFVIDTNGRRFAKSTISAAFAAKGAAA
jgi:hypothetical protein